MQEIAAVALDDRVEVAGYPTSYERNEIVLHYHIAGPGDRCAVAVDQMDVADQQSIVLFTVYW